MIKFLKKLRAKRLYRWLGINKNLVVMEDEKEFLANIWDDSGFKSFIAFRDLTLLKEIGLGLYLERIDE